MLERLGQSLLVLGIPGLFLIAFLDSAAIPLAGGPDAVVVLLAWHRAWLSWLIALIAAIGSTLGCLVLYRIGRAGGEVTLARLSEARRAAIQRKLDTHGIWTVLVAVLMPPPFPTKPLILAAGVFNLRPGPFITGVFAGRLLRYGLGAYLGAHFGDQAATVVKEHTPIVLAVIFLDIVLVLAVQWLLRKK